MGCTPPVPLRRWLVSSPPRFLFLVHPMHLGMYGVRACGFHDVAMRFLRRFVDPVSTWESLFDKKF